MYLRQKCRVCAYFRRMSADLGLLAYVMSNLLHPSSCLCPTTQPQITFHGALSYLSQPLFSSLISLIYSSVYSPALAIHFSNLSHPTLPPSSGFNLLCCLFNCDDACSHKLTPARKCSPAFSYLLFLSLNPCIPPSLFVGAWFVRGFRAGH